MVVHIALEVHFGLLPKLMERSIKMNDLHVYRNEMQISIARSVHPQMIAESRIGISDAHLLERVIGYDSFVVYTQLTWKHPELVH